MHLSIGRDMADVGRANLRLEEYLESRGVAATVTFTAALVLEEIVTNAIKYGFDDEAPHEIRIDAGLDAQELVLRIADDGRPFDPLAAPPPDFDRPVESRSPGGLGLHLVRSLARSVEYQRAAGQNVVTVRFSLT